MKPKTNYTASEFNALRPTKKKPAYNESILQQQCVKWFREEHPYLAMNLFAISNEGARTKANGARLKAQGMLAGTADMFLAASGDYKKPVSIKAHGLFIEFKYGKNKQSLSQVNFEQAVTHYCYRYELIYDFDSFKQLIQSYL